MSVHKCILFISLLAITLSACRSTSTPATQVVAERLTAEIYGRLIMESGCLRIQENGTSRLIVYPPGMTAVVKGENVSFADTPTHEQAEWKLGGPIWMGGGEIPDPKGQTDEEIPPSCLGPYWLAGNLEMYATAQHLKFFLESQDRKVEITTETSDLGFSTTGTNWVIDGKRIAVFEFVNEETAKNEASLLSPDGTALTRTQNKSQIVKMFDYIATPHFFQKDRLIVLYAGEDSQFIALLEKYLGSQIAGGN